MKKLGIMLFAAVLTLGFCTAALADTDISATGTGQVSLTPDTASVYLGVSATNADAGQALTQVNETLSQVRQALVQAGVDPSDVSTSSIDMYTQIDYSSDEERISGYVVSHRLTVVVRDTNQLARSSTAPCRQAPTRSAAFPSPLPTARKPITRRWPLRCRMLKPTPSPLPKLPVCPLPSSGAQRVRYLRLQLRRRGELCRCRRKRQHPGDIGTLTVSATVSAVFEAQ